MGIVILLLFLVLAAFLAALVYAVVAFARTGDLLRRVARIEIDIVRLTQGLKKLTAEQKAPSAQPTAPEVISPSVNEKPAREQTREERFASAQTPPPVPKILHGAEPPEKVPPEEETPAVEAPAEEPFVEERAAEPPVRFPGFHLNMAEKARELTKNLSFEMLAGTKGLLWAGVITLVVGIAFFLKYLY
ncbi:MAG: hypothetical protein U9Q79_04575, partial [Candidatus Hydrogenedentes bacterium]|nr:hypothetical protein [Candidatus Hydrogenedentota bacterium]